MTRSNSLIGRYILPTLKGLTVPKVESLKLSEVRPPTDAGVVPRYSMRKGWGLVVLHLHQGKPCRKPTGKEIPAAAAEAPAEAIPSNSKMTMNQDGCRESR